jgi:hypothetical protein
MNERVDGMLNAELDCVHQRLNEIHVVLAEIRSDVKVNTALCADCRPKVMGNGKESLDHRITRLEEARAISKTFILGMVSAAGAIGSIAGAMLRLLGI